MIVCPWKDLGRYAPIIPGLEEAMKVVAELTDLTPRTIPLSDGNKILVQQNTTKDAATQKVETHRNYLDIQYLVEGEETMGWAPTWSLTPADEYNPTKDKQMFTGHVDFMRIAEGYCYVVWPEDGHMPGVHIDTPKEYKKLVIKLKV
jgi:YhcH/YjgK/YiaL family protein